MKIYKLIFVFIFIPAVALGFCTFDSHEDSYTVVDRSLIASILQDMDAYKRKHLRYPKMQEDRHVAFSKDGTGVVNSLLGSGIIEEHDLKKMNLDDTGRVIDRSGNPIYYVNELADDSTGIDLIIKKGIKHYSNVWNAKNVPDWPYLFSTGSGELGSYDTWLFIKDKYLNTVIDTATSGE